MVDLHAHVLFGIDDGARTIEDSLEILKKAQGAGVRKMVATPHFSVGDDVNAFLKLRDENFKALLEAVEDEGIDIKLKCGAEVYITDEIYNEDKLHKLTIGNSRVMLTEFKYHGLRSETVIDYVDEIMSHNLKVLVAHPERYSYLRGNKMLINALISRGVLFQINAISLFDDSEEGNFARMLSRKNIASVIGSDIHHVPSERMEAIKYINKNENLDIMTHDNPNLIFENLAEIENIEPDLL